MNRLNKTFTALVCGLFMTFGAKAQTEEFDLSTAVGGPSTAPILIAPGNDDDTWSVERPDLTVVTPRVCAYFPSWADDYACGSRWISPRMDASANPLSAPTGNYRYFTSFTLSKCTESAVLDIRKIGGDNKITAIRVNNFVYPFNSLQPNDFSPLIGPGTVTINPLHLQVGTNTLSVLIFNDGNSYTGFNFCGKLSVVYTDNVVPSISGNSVFCAGSTFTFTGSDGPGTAAEYQWQLLPASGSVPLYSSSVTAGSPGSFTFPNTLFTCNTAYRVRLRVNTCSGWLETDKSIAYSCPVASAVADQTICQGVCVNLGAGAPVPFTTYKWTVAGTVVGTAAQLNACPAVTTTYRLEANRLGCTVSDEVTITVLPNNPDFNITYVSAGTTAYYGAKATPVAAVPSGGGFGWFLEEVGESFTISNPDRWWSDPVNVFQGFDRTVPGYSGSVTWLPGTPATGKFLFNKTYRLSRGTWTATCPWNGVTKEFGLHPRGPGEEPMLWVRDVEPLDFDNLAQTATASVTEADLAGGLRIFPNPSTGVFTVSLDHSAAGLVEVFDVLGKKVETVKLSAGTDTYRVDLSGYAKGIYVVNVTAGDVKQSRKILLQ